MVDVLFGNPVYLWFLLLVPLLIISHFFSLRLSQAKAMRFANFETLKRIDGKRHLVKNYGVLFLRMLAILALVGALSEVTLYYEGVRSDFDYVIAMDVSPSMITTDIFPTRLDAAKIHAITFLNSLDAFTEVGVVSFSGITYVRQSMSENAIDSRLTLNLLNISRVSGTDISGAIVAGTNLLVDSERGKSIVLFTDGVDTAGSYLDDSVDQAIAYALEHDVVVHTVGYGTEDAAVGYLPELYGLTSSVDQQTLIRIAEVTGGEYFFPTTNQEADQFFTTLASRASPAPIPLELKEYGILLALLFLGIEWVLINLRFRRIA